MSCWDILEISYTKDKKAIKKAYAVKLRQIKVDEEPQEFQRLKEAFDQAIQVADGKRNDSLPFSIWSEKLEKQAPKVQEGFSQLKVQKPEQKIKEEIEKPQQRLFEEPETFEEGGPESEKPKSHFFEEPETLEEKEKEAEKRKSHFFEELETFEEGEQESEKPKSHSFKEPETFDEEEQKDERRKSRPFEEQRPIFNEEEQEVEGKAVVDEKPFPEKVQELLNTFAFFDDLPKWQEVLSEHKSWSIHEFMNYSYLIQEMLANEAAYLAKPVIELLFETFQLDELTEEINSNEFISEHFIQQQEEIRHAPAFNFSFWKDVSEEERLEYFRLRYQMYSSLNIADKSQLNWQEFQELFERGQEIYAQDGDLYLMKILEILVRAEGNLTSKENSQPYRRYLKTANSLPVGDHSLVDFFEVYIQVWENNEKVSVDVEAVVQSAAGLPPANQHYFLFMLFFYSEEYSAAVKQCKDLSRYQLSQLIPFLNLLRRKLDFTQRIELEKIVGQREGAEVKEKGFFQRHPIFTVLFCIAVGLILLIFVGNDGKDKTETQLPDTFQPDLNSSNFSKVEDFRKMERLIREEASVAEGFAYYYLYSDDAAKREEFLNSNGIDDGLSLLSANKEKAPLYPEAEKSTDFSFETDTTTTDGKCCVIYYEEEAVVILKLNYENKIVDVLGEGWTEVEEEKFTALEDDINVRPSNSAYFLFYYYLPSSDRQEVLEKYPQYVTDELMPLMQERVDDKPVDKYSGSTQKASSVDNIPYIVYWDKEDELWLIIQFDDYGRLAHIYLDGWEDMSQKKVDQILENCVE